MCDPKNTKKTSAPNATHLNNDLKPCDRSDRIGLNGCRMSYCSAPLQLSFDHTRRHQHKSHHYSELMGIPSKSRINAHCYMIVFICTCVHFANRHTFLRLKCMFVPKTIEFFKNFTTDLERLQTLSLLITL